jgi:hypothetical protein
MRNAKVNAHETIERDPYAPAVAYRSRRACVRIRKLDLLAHQASSAGPTPAMLFSQPFRHSPFAPR